jgi:hypothetical protein
MLMFLKLLSRSHESLSYLRNGRIPSNVEERNGKELIHQSQLKPNPRNFVCSESCIRLLKFYNQQIAAPIRCKCSTNHFPRLPKPKLPDTLLFNGTTFGIWLLHRDLEHALVPFSASSNQQNLPPNFLGSHRLLSATNSVRSYWTSDCFNRFLECSSTNFW